MKPIPLPPWVVLSSDKGRFQCSAGETARCVRRDLLLQFSIVHAVVSEMNAVLAPTLFGQVGDAKKIVAAEQTSEGFVVSCAWNASCFAWIKGRPSARPGSYRRRRVVGPRDPLVDHREHLSYSPGCEPSWRAARPESTGPLRSSPPSRIAATPRARGSASSCATLKTAPRIFGSSGRQRQ